MEIRRLTLRQKEDRKMKTVVNTILLTKNARPFLLWVVVSFPGRCWGLFFMSRDVLGAFSATLRASLGFAQSKYFRRPLVPRLFRSLVKALPGDDVRFARVRLRHNNREPFYSPSTSLVPFVFSKLLGSWEYFLNRQRLKSQNGNF